MICKNWRVRFWPVTWELTLGFDRLKTTPDRSALAAGCTTTLKSHFQLVEFFTNEQIFFTHQSNWRYWHSCCVLHSHNSAKTFVYNAVVCIVSCVILFTRIRNWAASRPNADGVLSSCRLYKERWAVVPNRPWQPYRLLTVYQGKWFWLRGWNALCFTQDEQGRWLCVFAWRWKVLSSIKCSVIGVSDSNNYCSHNNNLFSSAA